MLFRSCDPGAPDAQSACAETAARIVLLKKQTRANPALLNAPARAFRWRKMLDEGRYGSISELAAAEKIKRGYLGKVLQLTLLAPSVVEAILRGVWTYDCRS